MISIPIDLRAIRFAERLCFVEEAVYEAEGAKNRNAACLPFLEIVIEGSILSLLGTLLSRLYVRDIWMWKTLRTTAEAMRSIRAQRGYHLIQQCSKASIFAEGLTKSTYSDSASIHSPSI